MNAASANAASGQAPDATGRPPVIVMVLVWLWVVVPFCYGLYQLLVKIPALFGS
jgi:hypothetical protein